MFVCVYYLLQRKPLWDNRNLSILQVGLHVEEEQKEKERPTLYIKISNIPHTDGWGANDSWGRRTQKSTTEVKDEDRLGKTQDKKILNSGHHSGYVLVVCPAYMFIKKNLININ